MCLQTTWEKPKIAKKDIIVYKLLREINGILNSPFEEFTWELDKEYFTEIKKTTDHSWYDDLAGEMLEELKQTNIDFISIGKGFHSALKEDRLKFTKCILFKCIIPKGSEYYIGLSDLVVSNRIIIKERI